MSDKPIKPKITKMTITTGPIKPKPKEGDIKQMGGKTYVRQQRISQGCYVVSNGRPCFEWVERYGPHHRSYQYQQAKKRAHDAAKDH